MIHADRETCGKYETILAILHNQPWGKGINRSQFIDAWGLLVRRSIYMMPVQCVGAGYQRRMTLFVLSDVVIRRLQSSFSMLGPVVYATRLGLVGRYREECQPEK